MNVQDLHLSVQNSTNLKTKHIRVCIFLYSKKLLITEMLLHKTACNQISLFRSTNLQKKSEQQTK